MELAGIKKGLFHSVKQCRVHTIIGEEAADEYSSGEVLVNIELRLFMLRLKGNFG